METPMIYKAISKAMAEIGAIGKDKRNQQQGFQYRGIDDVMNALYPVLSKNGLFLAPEVLEHTREERQTQRGGNLIYSVMKIKYTLYAEDGSNVSATVIGEGMDSADKSSNKAMSVAMKYAMFQLFCIPTEEMLDPDASSPEPSVPKPAYTCYECGCGIFDYRGKDGKVKMTADQIAETGLEKFGKILCVSCAKKAKEGEKNE